MDMTMRKINTAELEEIEANLALLAPDAGVKPGGHHTGAGDRPDDARVQADAVYQALEVLGLVQGGLRPSGMGWGVDVTCPWVDEHTGGDATGAFYVPILERFKCHHGHCEDRNAGDLRLKLDELLRDDSGGVDCLVKYEFDEYPAGGQAAVQAPVQAQAQAQRPMRAYENNEDSLARLFADRDAAGLRYDHMRGCWYLWDRDRWRQDVTRAGVQRVRETLREYRAGLTDATAAALRSLGKTVTTEAVERAARADPGLATDGLSWDLDPFLAGAPGCEVDLSTGETRPPDPAHMVTRQLLTAPADIPTPLWDQFLAQSTGGDAGMAEFLQAWAGYCLTGDTSEEAFVFVYGAGGNGKGTFLYTISTILADYAARTPADVFMVRKHDAHPTEVARLAGVRMVVASEIEDGRTFNVGRLKDFTGRDGKATGRFMRQDFFQFTPQFKVTFVGNNQPRLVNVDDAIRRRLILVPFTRTPARVDITLKDRLAPEYPGILSWMIRGELRRRAAGGLQGLVPAAARTATDAYLGDQDTVGSWAADNCVFGPAEKIGAQALFEDYKLWCHSRGVFTETGLQDFSRKFLERFSDCRKSHTRTGKVIEGVSISTQDDVL